MTLIGQILWAWPFLSLLPSHATAFALSTLIMSMLAVVSAYSIGRMLASRSPTVAAVLLLVLAPGFLWNTSTFMTDMPTLALELLCIVLGMSAISHNGRGHWVLLTLSLLVGLLAFSIREFALCAPVAVLYCAASGRDTKRLSRYVILGFLELTACAAIYLWWLHQPGGAHEHLTMPSLAGAIRVLHGYFTFAFLLSPAVAIALWRRTAARKTLRYTVFVAVPVLLLGLIVNRLTGTLFVGNILLSRGALGQQVLAGTRPLLFPVLLWELASGLAIVSGAGLALLGASVAHQILRNWKDRDVSTPVGLVRIFALVYGLALTAFAATVPAFFDRYLWPLVFVVGLLLLRNCRPRPRTQAASLALASVSWVAVALTAFMLTLNASAYSAARWHAGEFAVSKGVPADQVDAGFEWVGAHSHGLGTESRIFRPAPPYETTYVRAEAHFTDCAVVSNTRNIPRHLLLLGRVTYRLLFFAGPPAPLYVYRVPGCDTQARSSTSHP